MFTPRTLNFIVDKLFHLRYKTLNSLVAGACRLARKKSPNLTEAELRAKFRELAGTVLTSEGAAQVEATIDRSEAWPSLAALTDLLRRYGRP